MSDANQPPPPTWGTEGSSSWGGSGQGGPPPPGPQSVGPPAGYQPPQGGYQPPQAGYQPTPSHQPAPGYQPQQQPPQNGLGTAALTLGIIGLVTSFFVIGALPGLVAIVLGFVARGKVKRGEANNGGMALTGIITGFLSLLIPIGLFILGAAVFFGSAGLGTLTECVVSAGQDQVAIEQCERDFESNLDDTFLND